MCVCYIDLHLAPVQACTNGLCDYIVVIISYTPPFTVYVLQVILETRSIAEEQRVKELKKKSDRCGLCVCVCV